MSVLLQDSFTDTNGTALSSHTGDSGVTYTRHASFTVATITIEDNRAAKDTDAATAVYYANNITDPKFFEVEFTIIDKSNVSRSTGIEVGIDTGSDTAIVYRRQNATTWQLLTIIASTPSATLLSTSETFSAEASHTLKLRRIPETNDYECFLDNVSLGVVTISDAEFLGTGKIGIRATNSQGAGAGYHLDNLSVRSLAAPKALHRGRHFSLFDDEEVNRAEFWPAIAVGATLERSTAISATGNIATAGESFSVFSRSTTMDGAVSVTVSGESFSVVSANTTLSATAGIAAIGLVEHQRSASLLATVDIVANGARVIDRSSSFTTTAGIESSGEFFTVFESTVSLSASASIESSAILFSVIESVASVGGTAAIEIAGVRIVECSLSVTATAAVESGGIFFTVIGGAAQVDATTAVTVSAESFSVFERQLAIDASAVITSARQVELSRPVSLTTVADIAVIGGIEGGIFEHERSATVSAAVTIESSAISFSIIEAASAITASGAVVISGLTIRERTALLSVSAAISTSGQRDLQRSVVINTTAGIASSGISVSGAGAIERAAAFSATASIAVSATFQHPTPARRTFVVNLERRVVIMPPERRVYVVPVEDREEILV